jgi:hypothetical protein
MHELVILISSYTSALSWSRAIAGKIEFEIGGESGTVTTRTYGADPLHANGQGYYWLGL